MAIVAQMQNLRQFVTSQLPDVIDWTKHVRSDPMLKTTGDIAYVEIVTPYNKYKLAMGSAYAEPPHGAPETCKSLGWVTFHHVGEDKYVLAPKNDLTYQDISKHIHTRELTDSLAICRRDIAEADNPKDAGNARIRMAEVATKAEKWGIKANIPEASASQHVNALPPGEAPRVDIRAPSPVDTTTERVASAGNGPAPFVGAPVIYYGNDRIAGMDVIPGVLVKMQPDGRAAMFLMADLNEITYMDNVHRRGTDAGNGRVHQTNCWDFNPQWLSEQARVKGIELHLDALATRNHNLEKQIDRLLGRIIDLEAKPKRGRPPKAPDGEQGEIEGAEFASELEPTV